MPIDATTKLVAVQGAAGNAQALRNLALGLFVILAKFAGLYSVGTCAKNIYLLRIVAGYYKNLGLIGATA